MFDRDPYRSKIYYAQQGRGGGRGPGLLQIARYVNWGIVLVFVTLIGFFVFVLANGQAQWVTPGVIGLVLVGWIFSLCLHEFAHAATAYLGGDHSDSTISYLSFNPLKYVHPFLSILIPILFIFLGGIGLPGGAVYLRRDLVRSRAWQSMISLAGPLMNLLVLVVIGAAFYVLGDRLPLHLAAGLAALALFEATAILLNLIPIPGLDGFGAIQPWLSYEAQRAVMPFYNYGFIIIFFLFFAVPAFNQFFFNIVFWLLQEVQISPLFALYGLSFFPTLQR